MAMWVKCRQRRPTFFSTLLERVPPWRAVKKGSPLVGVFGQPVAMFHRPFHFVRDESALNDTLFPSSSSAVPAAARLKR